MPSETLIHTTGETPRGGAKPGESCILVLFGASGDLTRRLLTPALLNLACDGLLPERFAIVGFAAHPLSTDEFRARLTEGARNFGTRPTFDAAAWEKLVPRLHYVTGDGDDPAAYARLAELLARLEAELQTGGNLLFYLAVPPVAFGPISAQLDHAGFTKRATGWSRLVVEKPFGHDLASARALNKGILDHWAEEQVYRIDHYLGKETVQNLLAFRFANALFEPVWNRHHIDHLQLTVAETVGVEARGGYYDKTGVLRDMIQNHMFQMLAYVGMEPPASFRADAVRNEKARLLAAVRRMTPADVARDTVRGQYGPGKKADGSPAPGYRAEPNVDPASATETFAAMKLSIDNDRWAGVPVYLRSGKALWKRGTEIVVQFKRPPEALFAGLPASGRLESNRLVFHVQPDQGIELRFHAKTPGPHLALQKVNMRFDYKEAFEAARGTGYEVLLYHAMIGDATLFSRTDLVESAWQIAQPMLDAWSAEPPGDFPNYPAGSWGPKAAYALPERDGRHWLEVINRTVLERVPLFRGADPVLLLQLAMMLQPAVRAAGEFVVKEGEPGDEMYFLCRGQCEAIDATGRLLNTLSDGDFFGELSLLLARPRTASVRALTPCDLFVLERLDFEKVLRDHPPFAAALRENARSRYRLA